MASELSIMVTRLKDSLPSKWFSDDAPILNALLHGIATSWCHLHNFQQYLLQQTRISTAYTVWFDLIADDYFGPMITRKLDEADSLFRSRIKKEMLRERATREALRLALLDATGRDPVIFEPANSHDCGGLGSSQQQACLGLGFGVAGGWGNLQLPYQVFVTVFRPSLDGIALVPGWSSPGGGYGEPASVLVASSASQEKTTDLEISAAIARVLPAGTIAWMRIQN